MVTESHARTGEPPESFIPTGHPVLHCLPRGETGQVLGFHTPIKGLPMTAGEPARSWGGWGTCALLCTTVEGQGRPVGEAAWGSWDVLGADTV